VVSYGELGGMWKSDGGLDMRSSVLFFELGRDNKGWCSSRLWWFGRRATGDDRQWWALMEEDSSRCGGVSRRVGR
jgi:hypothetical protein